MPKRSFLSLRRVGTLRITIAILTPLMLMGALESTAAAQSIKCSVAPALGLFDGNGDGILTVGEIRAAAPDNAELQGVASQLEAKGISGVQYVGCDGAGNGTGTTPGTASGTGTTPGTAADAGTGSGTGTGTGSGTGPGTTTGGTGSGTSSSTGSGTSSGTGTTTGSGSMTTGGPTSTSGSDSVAGKSSTTGTGFVIGSLPNTGSGNGYANDRGTSALVVLLCAASVLAFAGAFASRRRSRTK